MTRLSIPRGGPRAGILDRMYETAEPEWLDDPGVPEETKARVIRGLDRFNRRVFAYAQFTRWVVDLLPPPPQPARVLELGAGHGELSARIAHALQHRSATVVASDLEQHFVDALAANPRLTSRGVTARRVDATNMDLPDGAFDVAVFTQSLHHLDAEQVVAVMKEGTRVASRFLIVDGWRSPLLAAIMPVVIVLGNYPAFHDGVISARKMWSADALRHLAQLAGVRVDVQFRPPGYLWCLVTSDGK